MKKIKINSEKQDNGIWGTPLDCYSIDRVLLLDDYKLLKFSAILIAFAETYHLRFSIKLSTENGFMLYANSDAGTKSFSVKYENYEVIDDVLYYFDNQQEHIEFLRRNKLKKIENA